MNKPSVFIKGAATLCAAGKQSFASSELSHLNLSEDSSSMVTVDLDDEPSCLFQKIPLVTNDSLAWFEDTDRAYQFIYQVMDQLIKDMGLSTEELSETSLFLGSSSLDISTKSADHTKQIWLSTLDHINQVLIEKYGLSQLNYTLNTACTSSTNAIIYANRLLKTAQIKRAIVIGCEFYNKLTLKGFSSLGLLSEDKLLAFSNKRNGIILGEAVTALLLSTKPGENDCLEIIEGYSSCDSYSLTTTQEDGSHMASVIEKALVLSKITSQEIDLIKIHGTASPASDSAELQAIKRVFSSPPPVFALKPFLGHTLGACGAVETAITSQLIKQNSFPRPIYADNESECLLPFLSSKNKASQFTYILNNYCGFGGNNAALITKVLTANLQNNQNQPCNGNSDT